MKRWKRDLLNLLYDVFLAFIISTLFVVGIIALTSQTGDYPDIGLSVFSFIVAILMLFWRPRRIC